MERLLTMLCLSTTPYQLPTHTFDKDIARQVDLRSTKLANLTFVLSKNGAGTNSADPENTNLIGYVTTDSNNSVGRDVVAEFSIPLRYISASAEPVQRISLKYKGTGDVDVTKKYWVVLQSIGDGEDNTVVWWNDDGKAASLGTPTYAAIRDLPYGRGSSPAFIPLGWRTIKDGPIQTATHSQHHHQSYMCQRHSHQGQTTMTPHPSNPYKSPSGVVDSKTMQQYLGLFGEYASRVTITYDFPKVSIPDIPIRVGYSLIYYDSRGK